MKIKRGMKNNYVSEKYGFSKNTVYLWLKNKDKILSDLVKVKII